MDAPNLVRRLHQHRTWVNSQLMAAAAQLTDEQRRASFAIGQGSIWKSLVHLYAAEYIWLETLLGNEDPTVPGDLPRMIPGNQQASGAITTFEELRDKWAALNRRWSEYLQTITEDNLDDQVPKVSSLTGKRSVTRRSDILLHLCTHGQYTTAQIVNMFRQSGVTSLPDIMLISMARMENG